MSILKEGNRSATSDMLGDCYEDQGRAQSYSASGMNSNVVQWASGDGQHFYTVGHTTKMLPPGAYEIGEYKGQFVFTRFNIDLSGLMRIPDTQADRIVAEIEKFWERSDLFDKFKITQKRGILIAGPSGCGKTCTSKQVCVDVIARGGIVVPYCRPDWLSFGLAQFRAIQPLTPIVVLMEDVDEIAAHSDSSTFLNILDGVYSEFRRIVFMATTNYPDRLERRLTNRPSRFDCVITMTQPRREVRRMYLDMLAPSISNDVFDKDMAADDTDGLSFAHLKELFVSVVVLDIPYHEALDKVRAMADNDLPTGAELERGPRRTMGLISKV